MRKRILSGILAAALVLTEVPVTAFAQTDQSQSEPATAVVYGDVNEDGEVDLKDAWMLTSYLKGKNPSGFNTVNADVNTDNQVNEDDLALLRQYLTGDVPLGSDRLAVSFYDGDRLIDVIYAEKDKPLGKVPSVTKSSKENAILIGYYTDQEFTIPFYAENPVEQNMKVYAKYEDMGSSEQLNVTSFAQMDQSPDLSFEILRASGDISPEDAATLTVKDGSESVNISITESGDGVYKVKAPEGFTEGCSYELTLAEGWYFKDKPDTIRTASFTIKKGEVAEFQMSASIKYIQDTDAITYQVNVDKDGDGNAEGTEIFDKLTPSLVSEYGGTFTYAEAEKAFDKGDIICFYLKTKPSERDYINHDEDYKDDPEVYVKVKDISGTTVTFGALEEADTEELYEVPDNFPLKADTKPGEEQTTGTINISGLDTDLYSRMVVKADETPSTDTAALLAQAKEAISPGDFISIYTELDSTGENEDNVYYGKITAYDPVTGEITYEKSSREEIEECMNLYITPTLSGDDIISDEAKEELESQLQEQVENSGFAEEAANLLAAMAVETDSFRQNMGVQQYLMKAADGQTLSEKEINKRNIGKSFELSDDVELTVEIVTKGDQLHFKDLGSVQIAVGVDAEFEVETEDGGKIKIDLSAVFVEEVALGINVKGDLVKKRILGIPVPTGVCVSANIDIYNYTAVNFNVNVYTEEPEEKGTLDKFKDLCKEPVDSLGLTIPENLSKGLKTVGDALDKIDELQNKIEQAKDTAEQIKGYQEDIETLWAVVENAGTTEEAVNEIFETLGKTNITEDLMDMMGLSTETGLSSGKYAESLEDLMSKYSEMLEKETNWVTLVNKSLCESESCYYGIAINYGVNFVVRLDANIAMGSSLEYQVGKRYSFWFKIGLFKPKAGSSSMDLMDEQFAFQFYVMGKIGLKMGIEGTFKVGIGCTKFASVGVHLEMGPYVKLYGFFIYEYERTRQANTNVWNSQKQMAGALYLEFGLYIVFGADANALGSMFEWSKDFVDKEIPLLTAGEEYYPYKFAYDPQEDEQVDVKDVDGNSTNGITMQLPDSLRAVSNICLTDGKLGSKAYDYDDYFITLSNPNFKLEDGVITVTPPEGVQYMECDLTFTYKYSKMAFSTYDMSVTIPLVWTSLSDDEQAQNYTASVRVGNDEDGYQTVWSKSVKKNQAFDLPTEEEIRELVNYSDYKYEVFEGYGDQPLQGLTIIEDKTYDIQAKLKKYSVKVTDIQNADGTMYSKSYEAGFGEKFDFTDLMASGTDVAGTTYTKFDKLETAAQVDLTQAITEEMADLLLAESVTAKACYVDDSVTAEFTFTGIQHDPVSQKVRKGTEPDLSLVQSEIEDVLMEVGLDITEIAPELGEISEDTSYVVTCAELEGEKKTITFVSNGGTNVAPMEKVPTGMIGRLPTPVRSGYTFEGWYTDDGTFANPFAEKRMPDSDVTLYAKWTANQYKVTFHVNGGNTLDEAQQTKLVSYDSNYGTLPAPTKSGYGFAGWFTAKEGGEEVTAETLVSITADQTLYAHWKELEVIPKTIFNFGDAETETYEKGVGRKAEYTFEPAEGALYRESDFTIKYKRQGSSSYEEGLPVNAGTYDINISRPADNDYQKFDYTYTAVLTINKAVRTLGAVAVEAKDRGYTYVDLQIVGDGGIDDLSSEAAFTYQAVKVDGTLAYPGTKRSSADGESIVNGLEPESQYLITVKVTDDPNYLDAESSMTGASVVSTMAAPTESWKDVADTSWYSAGQTEFTLTTAEQLAGLSKLAKNRTTSFIGKKIVLGADIDLTGKKWIPVGITGYNFCGTFDGKQHKITGVYVSQTSSQVGLFARMGGACIQNVLLEDSYICGKDSVGGIVGYMYDSTVDSCVSHAYVKGTNTDASDSRAGGIAGDMQGGIVTNCVNYGVVVNKGNHTGGIVGHNQGKGYVMNCANFATVTGVSCVGGIVGQNKEKGSYVLNSYNAGTVKGTIYYVGAVVGRNYEDDGTVHQAYYLNGSATCNGQSRNASGNKNGSDNDGSTKHLSAAYFTAPDSALSRDADCGSKDLITALNNWVTWWNDKQCNAYWEIGENGYPLPAGAVNTAQGTKR